MALCHFYWLTFQEDNREVVQDRRLRHSMKKIETFQETKGDKMMVPATPTVMATSTTSTGHSRMSGVVMVTVDRMTRVNHGTLVEKRWKLILTECGITSTIDEILKIYAKAGIVEDLTVLRRVILTEGLKEKTTEVHTTEDRAGIIKM